MVMDTANSAATWTSLYCDHCMSDMSWQAQAGISRNKKRGIWWRKSMHASCHGQVIQRTVSRALAAVMMAAMHHSACSIRHARSAPASPPLSHCCGIWLQQRLSFAHHLAKLAVVNFAIAITIHLADHLLDLLGCRRAAQLRGMRLFGSEPACFAEAMVQVTCLCGTA